MAGLVARVAPIFLLLRKLRPTFVLQRTAPPIPCAAALVLAVLRGRAEAAKGVSIHAASFSSSSSSSFSFVRICMAMARSVASAPLPATVTSRVRMMVSVHRSPAPAGIRTRPTVVSVRRERWIVAVIVAAMAAEVLKVVSHGRIAEVVAAAVLATPSNAPIKSCRFLRGTAVGVLAC